MREILFRGKRLDNGEWAYGYVFDDGMADSKRFFVGGMIVSDAKKNTDDRYEVGVAFEEVDPSTIGRYTGTADENGVKIFEGDILWVSEDIFEKAFVVKFGNCGGVQNVDHEVGYVGFYVEPIGRDANDFIGYGIRTDILYWLNSCEMFVVGSIHDNPKLLEGNP